MGRKLTLLAGTVVVLAVIVEIAARQLFPAAPVWHEPQIRHLSSPLLGWVLPANVEDAWSIDAPVRTNRHGLRDEEFPVHKPSGELRILALGDSFTFALGVRFEELWTQQLEERLEASRGQPVQVINAGVSGYNTRQELIYLLAQGLAFGPDAVIVAFYWNDLVGNQEPLPDLDAPRVGPDAGWHEEPLDHLLPNGVRDAFRRSVLAYQLVRGTKALIARFDPPDDRYARVQRALLEGDAPALASHWDEAGARLLEIHAASAAQGAPVVMLAFPMENQVRIDYPNAIWGDRLKAIWEPTGMPLVDLEGPYRRALADGRNPFLPYDLHPNAEGMRIAAEQLLPALEKVLPVPADVSEPQASHGLE